MHYQAFLLWCIVEWIDFVGFLPTRVRGYPRGSRWLSKTSVMRSLRWEQCWGPTCWVCFQETLQELFDDPDVFFDLWPSSLKPQTLWNFQLTPEKSTGWKMNLANSKLTVWFGSPVAGCHSARLRVRFHQCHAVYMGFRGLNIFLYDLSIFQPNIGCRLKQHVALLQAWRLWQRHQDTEPNVEELHRWKGQEWWSLNFGAWNIMKPVFPQSNQQLSSWRSFSHLCSLSFTFSKPNQNIAELHRNTLSFIKRFLRLPWPPSETHGFETYSLSSKS